MSQETEPEDEDQHLFDVPPNTFEIAFYLGLLVWVGYILYETTGYDRFEDYFFPYILGVPIAGLIVLHLVTVRYPSIIERVLPDQSADTSDTELTEIVEGTEESISNRPTAERERYEIYMIGWVLLLPAMMYVIGMGWTILIYTFTLTYFLKRTVRGALIVTGVILVFVYVLFMEVFRMIVWSGVLGLPDPLQYLEVML